MHRKYHSCPASAIIPEIELIFTHPAQVHTSSTNVGSYITNLMFIQPKFANTREPQVHTHHWFTSLEPPVHKQISSQAKVPSSQAT